MPEARTVAVGDIHGHLLELRVLLERIPTLTAEDTLLFIGDYLDRGPDPAGVIRLLREELPARTPARIVALLGNHEVAWLGVRAGTDPGFVLPAGNGCLSTLRSFTGGPVPVRGDFPTDPAEMQALVSGSFFPPAVAAWLESLPFWYEDEHAI